MTSKTEIIGADENRRFEVALPCGEDEFSKFITSLLGKPQTISKAYTGSFEIDHKDIESTFNLVVQRVAQQNHGSLIQFTVKLVFDDNSSVLLNSIDDFNSYSEVRPLDVMQAHLSWSFLVKFQDRDHPEKQEIDCSFVTQGRGGISIFDADDSPIIPLAKLIGGGFVSFRISHTARTWGADIESLLSGHIKHILLPEGRIRSFVRRHSGKISFGVAVSYFVSSVVACVYSAGTISKSKIAELSPFLSDPSRTNEKINLLLELVASGFWGKFFFSVFIFSIFSLFTAIFIGIWCETSADTRRPSYILLTKKSNQFKLEADKKYQFKWFSFLGSIIVGVVTGVLGNILFATYWSALQ